MKVARSSVYYRPQDKTAENKADADLMDKIEAICLGFSRYGYRRVTAALTQPLKKLTLMPPAAAANQYR